MLDTPAQIASGERFKPAGFFDALRLMLSHTAALRPHLTKLGL
jgi:hypothetical protein